jgi:hypothetical protein
MVKEAMLFWYYLHHPPPLRQQEYQATIPDTQGEEGVRERLGTFIFLARLGDRGYIGI